MRKEGALVQTVAFLSICKVKSEIALPLQEASNNTAAHISLATLATS